VNVGDAASGPLSIRAFTPKPIISIQSAKYTHSAGVAAGAKAEVKNQFIFQVTRYDMPHVDSSGFVTRISLEISYPGRVQDTVVIPVFPLPVMPAITAEADLMICDNRTVSIPWYQNSADSIAPQVFQGGSGDGDGIIDPGEKVLLFVRLPRGLGPHDSNTFHPATLLNFDTDPNLSVDSLRYTVRGAEFNFSDAVNEQSVITINPAAPAGALLDLWLKLESLYFSPEGFTSPIQRHRFDYRKVRVAVGSGGIKK
jgi:hypothetical protein